EHLDGVGEVEQLKVASFEKTLVDLCPSRIGLNPALGLAPVADGGASALGLLHEGQKIGRTLVNRRAKGALFGTRSLKQGLVIAGDQTLRSGVGQRIGCEVVLKERPGARFARACDLERIATGGEQGLGGQRLIAARPLARSKKPRAGF